MQKIFLMHQRTIDKKKIWRTFFIISFYFPKKAKTVFDLYKVKINIFLNISSFLALKKSKNVFLLCCRLQNGKKIADIRVTVNIFWGPATKERGNIKDMKFWIWGPTTIWHNIECVSFFFFKITPPYYIVYIIPECMGT